MNFDDNAIKRNSDSSRGSSEFAPSSTTWTCGERGYIGTLEPDSIKHKDCTGICGRRFETCNHVCLRKCHSGKECGPCLSLCQVRCAHSKCQKPCGEPCAPCIEKCTWSCEHKGNCPMPCSAPCTRLPCNRRCENLIRCGHQCPGICGEECPHDYCQTCSDRQDARVDFLEMKTYDEINLDQTPIVVLGCGHFFTTESVDSVVAMNEVYTQDEHGEFIGLKDISCKLAASAPRCPDCNSQIRQYTTQRYNRVVNRFVIDEMSKRFLVSGKEELRMLERQIDELEQHLKTIREQLVESITYLNTAPADRLHQADHLSGPIAPGITRYLSERHKKFYLLQSKLQLFRQKTADKHQPAQKLADATIRAEVQRPATQMASDLNLIGHVPKLETDRRVTFGGREAYLKTKFYVLNDQFAISRALKNLPSDILNKIPEGPPDKFAPLFFISCRGFIKDCHLETLPKMAVEASIYYASTARAYQSFAVATNYDSSESTMYVELAKGLLEKAKEMCKQPFENSSALDKVVEDSLRVLGKDVEPVSAEEIAAIKKAMISGSSGLATHSGHWYNCVNGHLFAIEECGMPMEQARCPECGARVGGQNHQSVDDVTRAVEMED